MCGQRKHCVESAIKMYPEFKPMLIDDKNVGLWMSKLLSRLRLISEPKLWDRSELAGKVWSSDWLKCFVLSLMPNTLYTDTDVLHLKQFSFNDDSDVPYLMGVPADTAMMYSARACKYWSNLIDEKIKRQDFGTPQDCISGGDGIPITKEYYVHYGASENHHLAEDRHWWQPSTVGV